MEECINIDNRDDFGNWAIEVAKHIVGEQGFDLAKAACDGTEDAVREACSWTGYQQRAHGSL